MQLKSYLWWWYIDASFLIWEHGEEKLKEFIDVLILINIFILHITPITVKREFLIVKRSALIGLAQILDLLIGVVMTWKDGYKKEAIQKSKSGNQYWEAEQSVEMIFWIRKGLFKRKHRLHLIWFIMLFLKMSGNSFYLHQSKVTKKLFSEVSIIGFKNAKSLKDHLVRAVLP